MPFPFPLARRLRIFLTAALLAGAALAAGAFHPFAPARAQSLNFATTDSDAPIEVFADDGIEWQQDNSIFVARGNARAVRGEVEVSADVLRAYYREKEGGGTDIWRLDGEGSVKIATPSEQAFGEKVVYDLDSAILVLSGGKRVRLVTQEDEITADKQLEYWEKKQLAVARGNASAVRGKKRLDADVLVARFRKDKAGKSEIHRVEAFDNVNIATEKDKARADRGIYNVKSGIATLTGSVTITRGQNLLKGCGAEVNLNTGISKMTSCGPGSPGGGRVRGLLRQGNVNKK